MIVVACNMAHKVMNRFFELDCKAALFSIFAYLLKITLLPRANLILTELCKTKDTMPLVQLTLLQKNDAMHEARARASAMLDQKAQKP